MVKEDDKNKSVEEVKAEEISVKSNEPSWYHYLIVLGIFALVVGVFWFGYVVFVENDPGSNATNVSQSALYKYEYVVGNVTYNLYLENKASEVAAMDFVVELDKYDVLNTLHFTMVFDEYNGSDNGQIAKGSTKLTSFLKYVYHFQFDNESFVRTDVMSCENSSMRYKVITFDPYSDVNGIFFNETNGCVEFKADDAQKMVNLVDKFILEMVDLENVD